MLNASWSADEQYDAWLETNVVEQKQLGYAAVIVRIDQGNLTGDQLRGVARIAESSGDGLAIVVYGAAAASAEVRMLAASLLEHGGVLTADSTIKYNPDKAVLKLPIGAPIRLTEAGFTALAEAYFADLTAKFGQAG